MNDHLTVTRFGILFDNDYLTTWERQTIEKLVQTSSVSLALLIRVTGSANKKNSINDFANYQLYKKYVKWLYKPSTLRKASITDLVEKIPLLLCNPEEKEGNSYDLTDLDVSHIREAQLDFILNFARQPIGGLVLSACRFGVWGFRYGNKQQHQTSSAGFWEIYYKECVTTASLCRLLDIHQYVIIKEGFFRTRLHSHSKLVDGIHQELSNWPADSIRQLVKGRLFDDYQIQYVSNNHENLWPSDKQLLRFLIRLLKNKLQNLYKFLFLADQWNIGVVNRPIRDFIQVENLKGATVNSPVLPNRNVFYADCFAQHIESNLVVYFEYYDYRVRRGNISKLNYPWQASSKPSKVIEFPFHLSYPFLFGSYCMPEAWVTNSVRLYDVRQPVLDQNEGLVLLRDTPGIDSTLLKYANRYWLFYTRADRDPMLNLFISYADSLEGPWYEHSQNPVKSDIRSSRPAGPFFEVDGKLYRPSQDCTLDYGCGITLNEVVELTPFSFVENKVSYLTSLHPDYPNGIHTITAVDDHHTLIDFKRYRFIPMATLLALWMLIAPYLNIKKDS
jgi:hypothetical protein